MVELAVGILSILFVLTILYLILIQLQLRNMNRQLVKRLKEHTRQPVSIDMINKELNILAANINLCLKAEEQLRLDGIREEKRFKEMIANISHDLRTPLTAIKGYQQLMEKDELTKEQQEKLSVAKKYTDELGSLIERFFEYSYLVNAESELKLERVNLTNLVTECLAEAVERFEDNDLRVMLAEAPSIYILADLQGTIRIIQNLIRNCIAHSAGDITVQLKSGKNAVISFRNPVKKGIEIDVKQLFDRFYTADKARSKSTGLGLSIVKLLAEQMGGSVNAELNNDSIELCVELPLFDYNSRK